MNKILLDSSIIVDFLRIKDKKSTLLHKFVSRNYQLAISIITHAELYSGKSIWEIKSVGDALGTILSEIQILPLDENLSKKAGEIRARYGTELLDAIIAATAISKELHLATLNVKDFEKIDGINLLKT